jgi:hypothetical protein
MANLDSLTCPSRARPAILLKRVVIKAEKGGSFAFPRDWSIEDEIEDFGSGEGSSEHKYAET